MLLLVLVLHATIRPTFEVASWLRFGGDRVSRDEYYEGIGIPGSEIQAAEHIRARTEKDDGVFIWGWNIAILYLSERQTVSRFGYSMPLIMGEGTEQREAYRQEFLESLYRTPPVYIVVAPQSEVILSGVYDLNDFGELYDFVASRYVEEIRFGDLVLHRIKDS